MKQKFTLTFVLLAVPLYLAMSATQAQETDDSTIVYPAAFFEPYSPSSASDMLDRIPGVSVSGGRGGRGLGTGGDLLINGQRIAGKDNSPREQLNRIAAREVERIEIIRGTSGDLDVRGSSQVVNIVLTDALTRSNTTVELITRHNHDDNIDFGGSITHSRQVGNFQALVNLRARPNYENREDRESRFDSEGQLTRTMFQSNIRDQDIFDIRSNMSYRTGPHRMQANLMYEDSSHPRNIRRDFTEHTDSGTLLWAEEEDTDNTHYNWEIGGDYEYVLPNDHRAQLLVITNDRIRDNVRERFAVDPESAEREKSLFIESTQRTREQIAQGNYSLPVGENQDLRIGLERAHTRLDSSLLLGTSTGSLPPSDAVGGLVPRPELSNPGTTVEEMRYEGFAFHNWALTPRTTLESAVVYESSEISQTGAVSNARTFNFVRPSIDYRFNVTESLRLRANVERTVSQLSFASFSATADDSDRESDTRAGNPQLEPEQGIRYRLEAEYRLPNNNGVLNSQLVYHDIENYIGRINATRDPAVPLSAVGNIGPAKRIGFINSVNSRLGAIGLPDAILSASLAVFDSEAVNPFLDRKMRIGGRGNASLGFRHDVTSFRLNYGIDYRYHFDGGHYNVDITTITRNEAQPSLNMFVSKVFFDDLTVRLDSNNTLGDYRCSERQRYSPTTIDGNLVATEDSCSSRYRRLTLSMQTTF